MVKCKQQSGVALITAVLIIALAVTAAITIAANYQLNFHRTENAFNSGQAWAYAKGAEEWAMAVLARDQKDNTYDAYDVDNAWWNNGAPLVFPLPNGFIEGKLEDPQGKLNVNMLVKADKTTDIEVRKAFERLFTNLNINPGLVCAIIDWIDENVNPECPDGAEIDIYAGLEVPYLPSDQSMQDISELRLVHGFTQEIYNVLLPHVTALPESAVLNLNTASAEVLETIGTNIQRGAGEELVEYREDNPFRTLNDLKKVPSMQTVVPSFPSMGFATSHFLLNTKCVIGKSQVKMISTIHRGGGNNLTVIKRSQKI